MVETDLVASVILVKLVVLVLTLVLTHLTYQSYRRSQRSDILTLSVGFGSMALGLLLAGGLYQLLSFDILLSLLVEAVFSAFGLWMIVYSLYGFE